MKKHTGIRIVPRKVKEATPVVIEPAQNSKKQFVAMWCLYDIDNYFGHRQKFIQADSFEEAEQILFDDLEGRMIIGKYEYQIHELVGRGSHRIYDTRTKTRRRD